MIVACLLVLVSSSGAAEIAGIPAPAPLPPAERKAMAECRERIDRIDSELLRLLNERAVEAQKVGQIKKRFHQPIRVPKREEEILKRLGSENSGPLPADAVGRIWNRLFEEMRNLE
jgi:chorismate mutase-like protein